MVSGLMKPIRLLRIKQNIQSVRPIGACAAQDFVLHLRHFAVAVFDIGASEIVACVFEIRIEVDGVVKGVDAFFRFVRFEITFAQIIISFRVGFIDF